MSPGRARGGFTLAELLVTMVLMGLIGVAVTRLLLAETRLFELQKARRDARANGGSSVNVLFTDLRMVNDGASAPGSVQMASPETLRVRVPYAYGFVCGAGASAVAATMVPVDSAQYAMALYSGFAWRNKGTGIYTYVPRTQPSDVVTNSAASATCGVTAKLRTDTINGRTFPVQDIKPMTAGGQPGATLFLYQEVTCWLGPSVAYGANRWGLWRQVKGGTAEELVAPFDTTSRFRFYTRFRDTSAATVPTPLDSIVGVAIALNGASPSSAASGHPVKTRMETSVFFHNRLTP